MLKLNPDELRQISEEIDGIVTSHRETLDHNPQISRPLISVQAALEPLQLRPGFPPGQGGNVWPSGWFVRRRNNLSGRCQPPD